MPDRLIWLAAAFALGIWGSAALNPGLAVLYAAALAAATAAVWLARRESRLTGAALAALFFVAGMTVAAHDSFRHPAEISRYAGRTLTVYGTVAAMPETLDIDAATVKVRYIVAAEAVKAGGGLIAPAGGGVAVTLRQPRQMKRAAYGDRVTASGRLLAVQGYRNPGMVDVAAGQRLKGVVARMSVGTGGFSFAPAGAYSWQKVLASWRQTVGERMRAAMAPADAAVLNGVLFGGYYGIKQEVVRDFAASGLVHILSVSGSHIALIAGVVMWLGARLQARRSRVAAAAAAIVVFYAVFTGLTPPVVRSAVMGLIALGAVALEREKDTLQALALAALGMLAFQPALLFDISFQLSFSATAGLILLYPRLAEKLAPLPGWLAGPLAVTAAAQLGALPFMAWYFASLSLGAFVANLAVLPLLEGVLVTGLAASVAGVFLPLLAKILYAGCGLAIGAATALASLVAALPGSVLHVPPPGIGAGMLYYLMLAWLFGYLPARFTPLPELWRRDRGMTAAVAGVAALAVFTFCWYPRPVYVHFIDVGQGDAVLITTPHRRALLVDAGGSAGQGDFDIGERVVAPYLRHYGVTALDYLILSGGGADSAGGAAGVAAALPVERAVVVAGEAVPAALTRLAGKLVVVPDSECRGFSLDGVKVELYPDPGELDRTGDAVAVVLVSYGQRRFLLTGDLDARGERWLASAGLAGADVLKVSRHGARPSATPELLAACSPRYAVISAGYGNKFGHPHPETLARLRDRGITTYRTDRDGAVVFRTDGAGLVPQTYVPPAGNN